jgi:hypothetical protein
MTTRRSKRGIPATLALRWYRGDTRVLSFRWGSRPTPNAATTYRDLTGCTAVFVARNRHTRAELARRTTAAGDGIVLSVSPVTGDPETGRIVVTLTPAQSLALQGQPVVADVEVTFPGGQVRTPVRWVGELEVDETNV